MLMTVLGILLAVEGGFPWWEPVALVVGVGVFSAVFVAGLIRQSRRRSGAGRHQRWNGKTDDGPALPGGSDLDEPANALDSRNTRLWG